MVKQLNPGFTQKEVDIIAWLKVQSSQLPTHCERHHNSYVIPIKRNLNKLWKDVELGNLNKEECRKKIYDLMDELRRCIKDGSIKLNK